MNNLIYRVARRFAFIATVSLSWAAESTTQVARAPAIQATNLFADKLLARGKGIEVRRSQVDEAFIAYRATAAAQGQVVAEAKRAELEAQILDRLIHVQLLLGKATDEDRAKAKEAAAKIFAEYKQRQPSEEAFNRQLIALGMSPDQFRSRIMDEAIFRQVIDREIKSKITITEEQTRQFYEKNPSRFEVPERVRASHILWLTHDPATNQELAEAQKKEKKMVAEKVLALAKAGEDFAQLAREFSEDSGSREKGGELPPFTRGYSVPEFEAAAFALGANQISDLVTTKFGFHIIRVHEKIAARKIPYAEAQKDIKEYLAVQDAQKQLPDYLKKLRTAAGVEVLETPGNPGPQSR
jgi:peptidyl-prolyl cis-trans isomerase C